MSRRRRKRQPAVSLFAFQDVMAAVIGILFFVVLLLALNLVNKTAQASEEAPSAKQIEEAERRIAGLKAEITHLEQARLIAAGQEEKVLGGEAETLRIIYRLDASLRALYASIRSEQRKAAAARKRDVVPREQELARSKAALKKIEDAIANKGAKADERSKEKPRVAYILQANPNQLQPWLVELSGESIRVAPKDGGSSVITFAADTHAVREKMLLAWIKQHDPRKHYFVILIKPSGAGLFYRLSRQLRKLGFHIGTDLLPEPWRAFE